MLPETLDVADPPLASTNPFASSRVRSSSDPVKTNATPSSTSPAVSAARGSTPCSRSSATTARFRSLSDRTREEATELVEANGGSATSSVSSNTDYLVVGETPGRSKREDAEANDVPMLGEEEFEDLLEGHGVDA